MARNQSLDLFENRCNWLEEKSEGFLEKFGDNLDISFDPEYDYEEMTDFEGRTASHRHFHIKGHISYQGKNRRK